MVAISNPSRNAKEKFKTSLYWTEAEVVLLTANWEF